MGCLLSSGHIGVAKGCWHEARDLQSLLSRARSALHSGLVIQGERGDTARWRYVASVLEATIRERTLGVKHRTGSPWLSITQQQFCVRHTLMLELVIDASAAGVGTADR
jgi:hypothetical protein